MVWAIGREMLRSAPLPGRIPQNRYPQPRQDQLRCGILPKRDAGGKRKVTEILAPGPHAIHNFSTIESPVNFASEIVSVPNKMRRETILGMERTRAVFHSRHFNRPFQKFDPIRFAHTFFGGSATTLQQRSTMEISRSS